MRRRPSCPWRTSLPPGQTRALRLYVPLHPSSPFAFALPLLPPFPPPTNGLARSRLLRSPTFLFLIDSSSVLYELPLAMTFSLCEIYDLPPLLPAPKALAAMFARRKISLRHRELRGIILEISSDVMQIVYFLWEKFVFAEYQFNFRYSWTYDFKSTWITFNK